MTRLVSVLSLFAGASLLVVWLATPATSAPPQHPLPAVTPMDQVLPIVADVNAQVDRLRERLSDRAPYPPPSRDPFRFVAPTRPAPTPSPIMATPIPLLPDAPLAPRLVAILTNNDVTGTATRGAVLADLDDDVQFVAAGDAIGGFIVAEVLDDAVVLKDARSGVSVRLTLH